MLNMYSGHLEWHVGRYSVVVRYHMEDCHHWVYQICWKMAKEWTHLTMLHAPVKCMYLSHVHTMHCCWLSLLTLSLAFSYKMVMQQCWLSDPDQRPNFSQLRAEIDHILTSMTGYLDFSAIAPCVNMDKEDVCYAAIANNIIGIWASVLTMITCVDSKLTVWFLSQLWLGCWHRKEFREYMYRRQDFLFGGVCW